MAEEPTKKYSPKRDQYSRKRGASHLLDISCARCRTFVLSYQKDGPGGLRRLYLDRIFAPESYQAWSALTSAARVPNLVCPSCGNIIGSGMLYRPENRLAIRLRAGEFVKTSCDGSVRNE